MKRFLLNEKKIINLLADNKIVIVDGGARGALFPPFNQVNKEVLQVLRFDPTLDEEIVDYTKKDIIFNHALWHSRSRINLYVAEAESTSSVYPFNRELQQYIDPNANVRKTKEVLEVDTISLNDVINDYPELKIDFIKLDIHGAEYDVLKGASKVMENTLGLLIESWVIPIHKGQKLRGHIEALAFDSGFYVFEENHMGKWARTEQGFSKRQTVPIDTLFFKDPLIDENIKNIADAIKLISIANLFGHNAFALQLTNYFYKTKIITQENKDFIVEFISKHGTKTLREKVAYKIEKLSRKISNSAF